MIVQTKEEMLKEVAFQKKMLKNLKRWQQFLVFLSSLGIIGGYISFCYGIGPQYFVLGVVSVTVTVLSVILCAIIGLAHKRGTDNVRKITQLA